MFHASTEDRSDKDAEGGRNCAVHFALCIFHTVPSVLPIRFLQVVFILRFANALCIILSRILNLSSIQGSHYRLSDTVYMPYIYSIYTVYIQYIYSHRLCAIFCILSVLNTAMFCKHAHRYSLRQGCWWAEGGAET